MSKTIESQFQETKEYLLHRLEEMNEIKSASTRPSSHDEVKSLTFLDARKLKDFSAFLEFPGLEKISFADLSKTRLEDISPLKDLPRLASLDLGLSVALKDSSQLDLLSQLTSLVVSRDYEKLRVVELSRLERLRVRSKSVNDLSFLKCMDRLTQLHIGASGSALTSLEGIEHLTELEDINVNTSKITHLDPLRSLKKLIYVDASHCKSLKDVSGLQGSKSTLQEINLNDCPIRSSEAFENMSRLTRLKLRSTHITTVEPMRGCATLEELYLEKSKLSTLLGIDKFTSLKLLWVWDTKITSEELTDIKGLTSLLDFPLPSFKDIDETVLNSLTSIQKIDLFRSTLKHPSALNVVQAEEIRLEESFINDFSFLRRAKCLKRLDVHRTTFSYDDFQYIEVLPGLVYVRVTRGAFDENDARVKRLDKILRERDPSAYKSGVEVAFAPDGWQKQ